MMIEVYSIEEDKIIYRYMELDMMFYCILE